ncbi:unnamed protein product, partial [Rotaria magnacalcarata]
VEFAANLNRSNSSSATDQQKYFYVEPLRRTTNTPIYYSPLKSSPTISGHKKVHNRIFSSNLSNNEEFLTPDLLRLAGIQPSLSSSSDD